MGAFNNLRMRVGQIIAGKANEMSTSVINRAGHALGAWHDSLARGFLPREVNPYFYEALREAVGMLDGGINRLVTLDGIVRVRGSRLEIKMSLAGIGSHATV